VTYPRDIKAQITFLRTDEGGRQGPAFSGYRPQFYYEGEDWDAVQTYEKEGPVFPGETVTAYLGFLSPEHHAGKIRVGMNFLCREGSRTVARGHVLEIIELEASAKRAVEHEKKGA
jgi:translation elongation factor EF-Tu-like GTPase